MISDIHSAALAAARRIGRCSLLCGCLLVGAASCRRAALAEKPLGEQIFLRNCAACHGADGRGGPRPAPGGQVVVVRDLTDPAFQADRSDEELVHVLSEGKDRHMPAFEEVLSPSERRAVIQHIRRLDTADRKSSRAVSPTE
jgi:mono/diheme cytochrome c family protein